MIATVGVEYQRVKAGASERSSWQAAPARVDSEVPFALELQMRAASMRLDELRTKQAESERLLKHAEQKCQADLAALQSSAACLVWILGTEVKRRAEEVFAQLQNQILAHAKTLATVSRRQQISEIAKFSQSRLDRYGAWRIEFERAASKYFREIAERHERVVDAAIAGVRESAGALFGIVVPISNLRHNQAELEPRRAFADSVLDWRPGMLLFILPSRLFRQYLLREMMKRAKSELERIAVRATLDYSRRIDKNIAILVENTTAKLKDASGGIQRVIEGVSAQGQEISDPAEEMAKTL